MFQAQAGQHICIGAFAELVAPRAIEDRRPRPGHPIKDDQAQRPPGNVDAIAHGVGAQQAKILFGSEDIDQRGDIHAVDMLRHQADVMVVERRHDAAMDRAQALDGGEQAQPTAAGGEE